MLTSNEMVRVSREARDLFLKIMEDHEREAHEGRVCMGNRASAVAFLAHCLGVRGDGWKFAETLLADYDKHCCQDGCKHGG